MCRQQLLLIFNTKSQGNSEGKDALLPRIEIGEWWDSQLVPASSPMHFFFLHLELPKVLETLFCCRRSGWGCNMITALSDTLFFGFYSALTSEGGLVVTVALGE